MQNISIIHVVNIVDYFRHVVDYVRKSVCESRTVDLRPRSRPVVACTSLSFNCMLRSDAAGAADALQAVLDRIRLRTCP